MIFAVFHVVWATGNYVGLDQEQSRVAFAKTPFLIYDIFVASVCVLAVPVALALVQPWGRRVPRRWVGFFAWTGTGLLLLRGGASIIQSLYHLATGQFSVDATYVWELWFYLGAVLFTVSTTLFWRATRPAPVAAT